VIDRSGQWWRGEDFGDLAEYLRVVTAEGWSCPAFVDTLAMRQVLLMRAPPRS
jgi:hypothetical protein